MKKAHIKVLASGSTGNCYIIQAGEEKLVLECGISYKDILKGLNYSIKGVVGCLVTHVHSDHCKSFKKVYESFPKICAPYEVFEKYNIENSNKALLAHTLDEIKIGNFKIVCFTCNHVNVDSSQCETVGFLIQHKNIGKVLFATDTYYLKYKFRDVDHILIECNYSEETIQALEPHEQRVFKSHMSLETLKETLKTWDLSSAKTITLVHLSKNNGEPERFKEEIEKLTGIPTYIAVPGLEIS